MKENSVSGSSRTPKVSIGLPVFNGEKFIRKALDSLLAQTFKDFELIISDNGSTDKTSFICQEYEKKYPAIKYIWHNSNKGALFNFNHVLEQSKGDFFMWAADDDLWERSFIEKCHYYLENNPDAGLCFVKYWVIYQNLPNVLKRKVSDDLSILSHPEMTKRVTNILLFVNGRKVASAFYGLWRTDSLKEAWSHVRDLPNEHNYVGLDIALLVSALTKFRFCQTKEALFYKRKRVKIDKNLVAKIRKSFLNYFGYHLSGTTDEIEKLLMSCDMTNRVLIKIFKESDLLNNHFKKVLETRYKLRKKTLRKLKSSRTICEPK